MMESSLSGLVALLAVMLTSCSNPSAGPSSGGKHDAGDAGEEAMSDSGECGVDCPETIDDYCKQASCVASWPSDPRSLCGAQPGALSAYVCATDDLALFQGTDMSWSYQFDKATGKLSAITQYNANSKTAGCIAGPSHLAFSCSGDDTCSGGIVDCSTDGGGGAAGSAGDY